MTLREWFRDTYPDRPEWHRVEYRLLQPGQAQTKLAKSQGLHGRPVFGLLMPPHRLAGLGNVCPHAVGCVRSCIYGTGRYGLGGGVKREWVRVAWAQVPDLVVGQLEAELDRIALRMRRAGGRADVRLNVTSDVPFERHVDVCRWQDVVQFYDYTKWPTATRPGVPGYHLTRSVTRRWSVADIAACVAGGGSPAVVVPTAADARSPEFAGLPAVCGDDHDARYLDPAGHVVLLRLKLPTAPGADRWAAYRGGMVRTLDGAVAAVPAAVGVRRR